MYSVNILGIDDIRGWHDSAILGGFCCLLCIIVDFSRMHILAFVCIYILTSQIEGNFEKELLSFFVPLSVVKFYY